jgi:hypothetical protein
LPTYRGGNRSREAVDGEVARSVLEDDGGSFQCSSGSGNGFGNGGDDEGPSFQRRLYSGGLDSAGRQRKLGWLWRLWFGWQRCRVKLHFIGEGSGVGSLDSRLILSLV